MGSAVHADIKTHVFALPAAAAGQRLDQALASALPQYSRSRLQQWIRGGAVRLAGRTVARPRERVRGGEEVVVEARIEPDERLAAEPMALDVIYQDEQLLVLNKPAGLVVHPGAGNRAHTLQHGLLGFDPQLARVPRAGIVHRLDKDTSGLLLVARTPEAHTRLVAALAAREIHREYLAVVWGRPISGGSIDAPIGRSPRTRTRMAVRGGGRPARTHYRIEQRLPHHTLLRVQLETGRTHQIRVHLAHIGFPIVGDPTYGRPRAVATPRLREALRGFRRQALHAERLRLRHPQSGSELAFEAPLPEDLAALLAQLRAAAASAVRQRSKGKRGG
jgi:23S rRNA pseudouridine1911/1915/1917 synthase